MSNDRKNHRGPGNAPTEVRDSQPAAHAFELEGQGVDDSGTESFRNKLKRHAVSFSGPGLSEWKNLPDIGLYMDQVTTYLERQLDPFRVDAAERVITPSMINNYIKGSVIPRTEGKKYTQDHLARLLVVCTLKRVLSIPDLAILLNDREWPADVRPQGKTPLSNDASKQNFEEFYDLFRRTLDESLKETKETLETAMIDFPEGKETKTLRDMSLKLAVEAGTLGFAAEKLLALVDEMEEEQKKRIESAEKQRTGSTAKRHKDKKSKGGKNGNIDTAGDTANDIAAAGSDPRPD
ncbi:MAG: DUF1836 domain-containing protein [Rectinemataceae bacterium]